MRMNLLYIASNGRSGSSVLDRYCGQLTGVVTLGELQMLYHELYSRERRCGCGSLFADCTHWKRLADSVEDLKLMSSFRELPGRGKVLRFRRLLGLLRSTGNIWDHEYALATLRLIEEAYSKYLSCNPLFVDASKDLYRLNSLIASDVFSLTVVHLVKDPRSFVCSMIRNKTGLRRKVLIVRFALRYLIENLLLNLVTRKLEPQRALLLRYEDFAVDTHSVQAFINHNYAGLSDTSKIDIIFPQHPIAGNIARFGGRELKLDARWLIELTRFEKKIIWMICGLIAKRFGYDKR